MSERPRTPVNRGRVDWTGDNPGIYLKTDPDGDWTALAVSFRVTLSPHGRGHAMLALGEPDEAKGYPEAPNLCITDNAPLLRYLIEGYVSKFPTFRGRAGLAAMPVLPLTAVLREGSYDSTYSETMKSEAASLTMTWREFGPPFAVEVAPDQSATGQHDMYSLFMEAGAGSIAVDGRTLPGQTIKRPFFGTMMSSAFMAISETWVTPNAVEG